jgi:hypothetical protein
MDPVMQAVFGNMPIEKIISSNSNQVRRNNSDVIFLAIGTIVALTITVYVLYEKSKKTQKLVEDYK